MKFKRTNFCKPGKYSLDRNPQRKAAASRAITKERDSIPLFPELLKHQTAEERLDALESGMRQWHKEWRANRARNWREARRRLKELPRITQLGVLRAWNGEGNITRDPEYLLDMVWGIQHRGENPWTRLRILRQIRLLGQRRLPQNAANAIPKLLHPSNPYAEVRLQNRIERRMGIKHK